MAQEEDFWEYLEQPEIGRINKIVVGDNGDLFIATANGIYRSTNKGKHWKHLVNYFNTEDLVISSDGIILTVGKEDESFIYSMDNGESWKEVINPIEIRNPGGEKNAFGLMFDNIGNIVFFNQTPKDSLQTFYSTDLGISWHNNSYRHNLKGEVLLKDTGNDNDYNIVISGYNKINQKYPGFIFTTSNLGKSWKKVTGIPNVNCWKFLDNKKILVGTGEGLFYTTDRGESWENLNFYESIKDLLYLGDGEILLVTNRDYGGVLYTSDMGENWINLLDGIPNKYLLTLALDSNGNIYGGNDLGFFYTANKGKNWILSNSGFSAPSIYDMTFDNEGNIYLTSNGVYKSTDNGDSWGMIGLQEEEYKILNILKTNKGTLFAGASDHFYRSTNEGKTWEDLTTNSEISVKHVKDIFVNNRGHILAGIETSAYFRSTDEGESWIVEKCEGATNSFGMNNEGDLFRGRSVGDRP